MTPLWGHSETVAAFVASLIPDMERGFGPCQAMGVLDRDGRLVAGIVYNNWEPERGILEISGAAVTRRWMTKAIIRAMFAYPFDQLGCQAIVTRTDPDNGHLRRMWAAVGGVEHLIPRLRGRDKSELIIVVTEEAWRGSKFAENTHAEGQSEPQHPASVPAGTGAGLADGAAL